MQALLALVIYGSAFLAVILAVHAGSQVIFASSDQRGRINRRLQMLASGMAPEDVYRTLMRRSAGQGAPGIMRYYELLCLKCRQAGIRANPMHILLWVAAGTAALWLFSL